MTDTGAATAASSANPPHSAASSNAGNDLALARLEAEALGSQMLDLQQDCIALRRETTSLKKELADLRADHAVRRTALEIERGMRIAYFDRLERIEEALTECGYTDRAARVAAIAILEEAIADAPTAPPAPEIASDSSAPEKALGALRAAEKAKDDTYGERNQCVALIARMAHALGWRAGVGTHEDKPGETWEPDWRTLLCIDLPAGQASWHFHDSQRALLDGLPEYPWPWDGHDTAEKYRRVRAALSGGAHIDGPKAEKEDSK